MEMRDPPRCRRHFAPGVAKDPADEIPRGSIVARVPADAVDEQADVLKEAVNLLAVWPARAQEITNYTAVLLEDKTRFRFDIRIVARQIIGEELAILKYRVDRPTQEAGLTT